MASGEVDLQVLSQLVDSAYEQSDSDRRRTERSISLMIEELDANLREREHAADLLRGQKMKLDATITSMADAVLVADENGQIILANPAANQMFGERQSVGSEDRDVATRVSYPMASPLFHRAKRRWPAQSGASRSTILRSSWTGPVLTHRFT